MYTPVHLTDGNGGGVERERERDGKRENGSEEEAEDTEKGCTCLIKIDRKIIKRTGSKHKATGGHQSMLF